MQDFMKVYIVSHFKTKTLQESPLPFFEETPGERRKGITDTRPYLTISTVIGYSLGA